MRNPERRRSISSLVVLSLCAVAICGCHEGDAITDVRRPTPTPTPAVLQLAGTWIGTFGASAETFTATVSQNGTTVTAEWTMSSYGAVRFVGELNRNQLQGHLTVAHDLAMCPIRNARLSGTAGGSRISLAGFTVCNNLDVFHVSVELRR